MFKNICKLSIATTTLFFMISCSEEPHLPGLRIDVLQKSQNLVYKPSSSLDNVEITQIPTKNYTNWLTKYGNYTHTNINFQSSNAWNIQNPRTIDIGASSALSVPQTASPLIKDNVMYTIDTEDKVQAYDLIKRTRIWSKYIAKDLNVDDDKVAHGGMTMDENGTLYIATGYGYLVAMDSKNGQIKWKSSDYSALRSSPLITKGKVIVTTIANGVIAVDQQNGKELWKYKGNDNLSAILRTSTPVVKGNNLIATTSKGNVVSLNLNTGLVQWEQPLGVGDSVINTRDGLTTIIASPVITDDQLFVANGKYVLKSLDPVSGKKQWTKSIGTLKTPALMGDWLFVIDQHQKLMAIHKKDGLIKWSTSLPSKNNAENILWTSPIISSGSLLMVSTSGAFMTIDMTNGSILQLHNLNYKTSSMVRPFIINHKLYITSVKGKIYEYSER